MKLVVFGIEGHILVRLIIVNIKRTQVLELPPPKDTTGVDIAGREAIDSLNEKSPANDLLGWPVSMTRENVFVGIPSEPKNSQR
jgi:hypothetical protein